MKKNILLVVMVLGIIGIIWYIEGTKARPGAPGDGTTQAINVSASVTSSEMMASDSMNNPASTGSLALAMLSAADQKAGDTPAIEIKDPTGFINASSSFRLSQLVGKKVILLDFWTYSCINCIRTLPYLTAWYSRYHDQGLEIVGIHTPEFDFEKDINNVRAAVQKFGIQYPVILDSNYGTWSAYGNQYWPHEYLIDLAGYIVHDQIGEGNYDETEAEIQKLLAERSEILGTTAPVDPTSSVSVPQSDLTAGAMSPETYFGSNRNEYLANGASFRAGEQSFIEPTTVSPNKLYLVGDWNIDPEYAETPASVGSGSVGSDRIDYRYEAQGAYWVAGSANGNPIDVEVLRDGAPVPQASAGSDIFYKNGRSYVTVTKNRLYRIVDDTVAGDHLLEFIISSPGLQAYTFTFG